MSHPLRRQVQNLHPRPLSLRQRLHLRLLVLKLHVLLWVRHRLHQLAQKHPWLLQDTSRPRR